ncbi:hypothetical protein NDU88_008705 [Pleurodeles waltl]|uniref:Uncharacterized protein n=1 Tax=Pleurodeles waltl TaxID=8319 RepID=A0AAV7PSW3_PLEWA|nr:hypothetical protein NDU88_008705 [Pleurodeles waltl]
MDLVVEEARDLKEAGMPRQASQVVAVAILACSPPRMMQVASSLLLEVSVRGHSVAKHAAPRGGHRGRVAKKSQEGHCGLSSSEPTAHVVVVRRPDLEHRSVRNEGEGLAAVLQEHATSAKAPRARPVPARLAAEGSGRVGFSCQSKLVSGGGRVRGDGAINIQGFCHAVREDSGLYCNREGVDRGMTGLSNAAEAGQCRDSLGHETWL